MNLSELNILITGGANGIGKALSTSLADAVANVIVIDRDQKALDLLREEHPAIHGYAADLTDYAKCAEVTEQIFTSFGKLNVLVNNAGIIHSELLVNLLSRENPRHSVDSWHKTIDINLNAVFYLTSHVAERMVKTRSKGVIINISSISANGNAGQSAYAASKAAINALTVTWSKELGMFGIRCNAIAPGFFDTESTRKALTEAKVKEYQKSTPIGKLGKTDDLVNAVKFIIENDFYNGAILNLDGGLKL
ncbi:MAG: fabG [Flavipsychrobacter sp.]|jgi:3-oxoacyl-[acyl-carrier protein] reductase|nr:fabG [Flavipsychrobacter sp.]